MSECVHLVPSIVYAAFVADVWPFNDGYGIGVMCAESFKDLAVAQCSSMHLK